MEPSGSQQKTWPVLPVSGCFCFLLSLSAVGQGPAGARVIEVPGIGVSPNFSVQVRAEGRSGVIAVMDARGTEVQSLVCPLLRGEVEVTAEEVAAVREEFVARFVVADLDGDHYPDLAGVREFGAKWARFCVWLYDPAQHVFIRDFLAEEMELLTNLRPLAGGRISSSGIGPNAPWISIYRIAGAKESRPERQLIPELSCVVELTPGGDSPKALLTTRYREGRPVVRREDARGLNMRTALEKCER